MEIELKADIYFVQQRDSASEYFHGYGYTLLSDLGRFHRNPWLAKLIVL